ncbi:uncharacterized protein LOC114937595 [Nylanderia fulva]|uniref:uncharacterized protein LOC114937595 n=1 Tax=Nylanderia fulva TaxID=613905 RepID=UPI0010FAE4AA|nr:uncharacterized protein LOC114937595 [Nylanderia fulva]
MSKEGNENACSSNQHNNNISSEAVIINELNHYDEQDRTDEMLTRQREMEEFREVLEDGLDEILLQALLEFENQEIKKKELKEEGKKDKKRKDISDGEKKNKKNKKK